MTPEFLKYASAVGDEVARVFAREVTEASVESLGTVAPSFVWAAFAESVSAMTALLLVNGFLSAGRSVRCPCHGELLDQCPGCKAFAPASGGGVR